MHAFPPQILELKKYNFLFLISQDQLYVQVSPCFHLVPHLFNGFCLGTSRSNYLVLFTLYLELVLVLLWSNISYAAYLDG